MDTRKTDSRGETQRRRLRRRGMLVAIALAALVSPAALRLNAAPAGKTALEAESSESRKANKAARAAAANTEEVRLTDSERQHFEEFMKANSPKKWATYQQVLARAPEKQRTRQLENGLAMRYRQLEKIRDTDAERHKYEVQAIRIEDDAYGVMQNLRSGHDVEQNEKRLRELGGAYVDNRHAWREVRIQRVKKELNSLGLKQAIVAIQDSERESGSKKKTREDQIDKLVNQWKKGANLPKLQKTLPGGDRPPVDDNPSTEPAKTE